MTTNIENILLADPDKNESGKGDEKNDGRGRDKDLNDKKDTSDNKKENDNDEQEDEPDNNESEKVRNIDYDYNFEYEGNNDRKNFNFAAAGDFGCSQNSQNTISNLLTKKPELALTLGDLSIDKSANCWLDLISPFYDKLKVTLGYHDVKDGASKLNQIKESFGLEELYYSFDYRGVHFIVMSTSTPFNGTSEQYRFIEQDLNETSNNQDIDWIVVTSYGPFYTSPSEHPAKNDIRNIYHPIFDRYGVDLVLNGHNHNYQRTYPVTFNEFKQSNPVVTNGFPTGYHGNKDGIVYAIVGTGGEGFHPLAARHPYVATQFADKFGFLDVEISYGNPHTILTGTFYSNGDSAQHDYFTIRKEIKN